MTEGFKIAPFVKPTVGDHATLTGLEGVQLAFIIGFCPHNKFKLLPGFTLAGKTETLKLVILGAWHKPILPITLYVMLAE